MNKLYCIYVIWKCYYEIESLYNLYVLLKWLESEKYVVVVWLYIDFIFNRVLL